MIRYCISPIIGDGSGINNPFRAAVSDLPNVNTNAQIPTFTSGPNIGKPKFHFAFCIMASSNIAAVAAVSNAFVFPDYNLDGRMDGMESDARTGLVQSVQAYDLDGGLHLDAGNDDEDSYRQLIDKLGKQFEPAFSVNSFGVAEVAG